MEDYQEKLRLVYKNRIIILKFYPKNYDQLRDTFLSLFRENSYKMYIFKSYLSDQLNRNSQIILEDDDKFAESIGRIQILKKPAIFINVQDEIDDENELDKKNIEFIKKKENNLGFEINKKRKQEIIDQLKKEIDQKLENYLMLKNRVDNLNLVLKKMKNSIDLSQSKCKQEQENINNILNNLDKKPKEFP